MFHPYRGNPRYHMLHGQKKCLLKEQGRKLQEQILRTTGQWFGVWDVGSWFQINPAGRISSGNLVRSQRHRRELGFDLTSKAVLRFFWFVCCFCVFFCFALFVQKSGTKKREWRESWGCFTGYTVKCKLNFKKEVKIRRIINSGTVVVEKRTVKRRWGHQSGNCCSGRHQSQWVGGRFSV